MNKEVTKEKELETEENKYSIEKLNKLYAESESCDSDVFSEMRSNVLLVSGLHYKKTATALSRRLNDVGADKSKRLRLVKNHTAKGISDIKDIHASMTPAVVPFPANENEASHAKIAELCKIIWEDGKEKNKFEDLVEELRNSHITLGEACTKIFFDPIGGGLKAYKQKTDEFGEPLFKDPETGEQTLEVGVRDANTGEVITTFEMYPDESQPVFNGKITIEKFEPYNLLRHKNSKSLKTSKFLIYRKMVDLEDAKAMINQSELGEQEKEDKLEWIQDSGKTTYKIFDGMNGSFQDSEGQIMFREFYFRQSPEFPKGYFFITCEKGVLFEGEIPYGENGDVAFPIKVEPYDTYEGSSRGFSPIKRIRPCQAEINRCASSISETQLIMGADKVFLRGGAKISRGIDQPGMRVFHMSAGNDAQVVPGRSGEQYVQYLEYNVQELYALLKIPENMNPVSQNFDPRAELFKKQSQKARFTEPGTRFARQLKEICKTYLFLTQQYAEELDLPKILGPALAVDVNEFINADMLTCKVKLMEVSDDLESAMAKTLELDTILQYAGKDIDPDTLKMILSQYPAINKTQAFKHVTIDIKNVESDILALNRGEYRPANKYDAHEVYVKHLTGRMKEKDYTLVKDEIKKMFEEKLKEHEMFIAELAQMKQQAEAGFIPSGGALVKADLYVNPDPSNPTKQVKVTLPAESIMWLKDKLDSQGSSQALMNSFNPGAQGDIASLMMQGKMQAPMAEGLPMEGQMPMTQQMPLPQ